MQLNKQTDFAIRTLMYLAQLPQPQTTQVATVSNLFSISPNHLAKVVNKLANLGYLTSIRGRNGGIRLGKPAQDIIIGEVVVAMENRLSPVDCDQPPCILKRNCKLKTALDKASAAFIAELNHYNLADLNDEHLANLSLKMS